MIKQTKLHQDFYKLTVNDHTLDTEVDRALTPSVVDPDPLACVSFGGMIRIRIRIKKLDPDLHQSQKPDLDPHQIETL